MRGPEVLLLVAAIVTLLTAAFLLCEAGYDDLKWERQQRRQLEAWQARQRALCGGGPRSVPGGRR